MTAYHDSQSVEAQKARYSKELAAYTLRQWDIVRQAMEEGDRLRSMRSPQPQERSASVPKDSDKSSKLPHSIHAHDYAQTTRRHINGQRSIAAGKA